MSSEEKYLSSVCVIGFKMREMSSKINLWKLINDFVSSKVYLIRKK